MALNLYFSSTFQSVMDNIFPKPPRETTDGLIIALIVIPITWIYISSQTVIACDCIMKHKPKTKCRRRRKISAEAAARQKPENKLRRLLLKFFRKYIVLQEALAQQSKTSAPEGYPQADEMIYY